MGSGNRSQQRTRHRAELVPLESRVVPSTYHAANVAELQADLAQVSNSKGPDVIVLSPGNYELTTQLRVQNASDLTIVAEPGKGAVNLVGNAVDRVLEVDGGTVTLSGLTIAGGGNVSLGGGIFSRNATLTLQSTKLYNNVATQGGGGIFALGGSVNLQNSSVSNNRVGNTSLAYGGGIAAMNAPLTVSTSSINGNSVAAVNDQSGLAVLGTGGGIYARGGKLTINGSSLDGNTVSSVSTGGPAYSYGAAVATDGVDVTATKATIQNNTVSTFTVSAGANAGGAFSTNNGHLTVLNSTVARNMVGGWRSFARQGATVTLRGVQLDGLRVNRDLG